MCSPSLYVGRKRISLCHYHQDVGRVRSIAFQYYPRDSSFFSEDILRKSERTSFSRMHPSLIECNVGRPLNRPAHFLHFPLPFLNSHVDAHFLGAQIPQPCLTHASINQGPGVSVFPWTNSLTGHASKVCYRNSLTIFLSLI